MTSIDPRHRVADVLRQQAANAAAGGRAARSAVTAKAGPARSSRVPAAVVRRIAAIAPDDPQRQRKAVRIFLESALLQALDARLAHDASFPAMLDAVQQDMQDHAELARAVDRLGDLLLSG